ncbi:hypothetical protein ILUMI_18983 [Ignelater luminosus]|uniref:Suppressor of fused homolog n=1 Tax=Ignelater luminosus TaxID=2038154 RepID=A0A8K0G0C9_IGNLU|nr:hypothetical protein ILUMI_18983 [Ignelater luminosus]
MDEAAALPHGPPINMLPPTPAGLESLYSLCRKIYPDQPNPLQVTALLKYWLSGPDPLDYISMYANPGIPHENIPPHWHYISFGLSDLHGDGRVHDISGPDGISGYGFELTFRLKRQPEETAPPTWPATLMQSLAKYVFQSGNTLCAGDHVSWHCALDNSESRIQHMLMTSDMQLKTTHTPFGTVDFVQIVGICAEELRAAQQWNGDGVLKMLSRLSLAGGPWLITDMRRGESMFELDPSAHEEVERGFELEGSNLSGVSARCSWAEQDSTKLDLSTLTNKINVESLSRMEGLHEQVKPSVSAGLQSTNEQECSANYRIDDLRDRMSILESTELLHIKKLEALHLIFNLEAGSLLPLAIRGRVKHGRHFTFKSVLGETAITLVANSVTGTLVDSEHPFVAQGTWLQVLIPDDLAQDMATTFQILTMPETLSLPKTFVWPEKKLSITIVADKI